ncbi:hypothetical protein OHS33_38935 (plasmid) [Streptomyces sp. NBC_00536]|uniref:hypothetical protein n=1 Tax=Streptomyces sp. NBC_00536 TaxID=2975769 RepID=UPI002E8212E2|nr:hypothetical protein [Streptomyces sp. NBC_00536]WUC84334.1 hypothetical protein OHS33_38935 [Streptomyces sp. NBC_00536]
MKAMERRPAPQSISADGEPVAHGAPALYRGQLAASSRDATYLSSPNVHGDKSSHVAVFTERYLVGGGMHGIGAACDPVHILMDTGAAVGAHEITPGARCRRPACRSLYATADRQDSDLDHIRAYYGLAARIGITVALGLRVRHHDRPGTIIDTAGQYLVVRLDDETVPVTVHATSGMEYEGPDGWVRAVPLPDPSAAV